MHFGFNFGINSLVLMRSGGGGGETLPAPSLLLVPTYDSGLSSSDNITNSTTPHIAIYGAIDWLENDQIPIYIDSVLATTHLVTAAEAGGAPLNLGLAPLTPGVRSLQAGLIRGSETSPLSAPLVLTIKTGPTLFSSVPSDDAPAASITDDIIITFSENIAANATLDIAIKKTADDTDFQVFDETDVGGDLTIAGATLTIAHDTFAGSTGYYMTISATSIMGALAHDFFAGISAKTALNFTTQSTGNRIMRADNTFVLRVDNSKSLRIL